MFQWLNSKNRHAGNILLALDIGTEFVKALVVKADETQGEILGTGKVRQQVGEMQNGMVTDIAAVISNCKMAISEAERAAGVTPDHLVLGIAGELIKGSTRTIRYRRHQPHAKIHLEELKNIVHKVQWKAFEQIRGELAHETGYNEIDVRLVSASVIEVCVDDYKVLNPIGFQGKELVITIFNAFSPLTYFGVLQSITAELNMDLLAMTSEPYALTRSLPQKEAEFPHRIFIDVGGGTTDIAVVRDGILEGTKMFTLGGRSFTKRLSHNLNISFSEAEEIKLAYSKNQLEKQSHKTVADVLKQDCEMWLTGVTITLNELIPGDSIPPHIFLCGGGSQLPEIKSILLEGDWWKNMAFPYKPQIHFISPKDLSTLKDTTHSLKSPQDITPMALAHLGIELASEEKVLGKILRKVVRLMQV